MTAIVAGGTRGALTEYWGGSPRKMAMICSATSRATRSCASAVEAPRWGVTMIRSLFRGLLSSPGLPHPQLLLADEPLRLRGQHRMYPDIVRPSQQLLQRHNLRLEDLRPLRRDEGVAGDDLHLQAARP